MIDASGSEWQTPQCGSLGWLWLRQNPFQRLKIQELPPSPQQNTASFRSERLNLIFPPPSILKINPMQKKITDLQKGRTDPKSAPKTRMNRTQMPKCSAFLYFSNITGGRWARIIFCAVNCLKKWDLVTSANSPTIP